MIELQEILKTFDKISLGEMNEVKLMDREESKFLIKRTDLPPLLKDLHQHYFVFSIQNKEILSYQTEYYDTPTLDFYKAHLVGKANRMKVRIRQYVDSEISFIEIKRKNNKGRTTKIRKEHNNTFPNVLENEALQYVKANGFGSDSPLVSSLIVNYKRITLVSKSLTDRITIDTDLFFLNPENSKKYEEVCIIEIKQSKKSFTPIIEQIKKIKHLREPLSKYCLGLLSLKPSLPNNLFKTKFFNFNKLIYSS